MTSSRLYAPRARSLSPVSISTAKAWTNTGSRQGRHGLPEAEPVPHDHPMRTSCSPGAPAHRLHAIYSSKRAYPGGVSNDEVKDKLNESLALRWSAAAASASPAPSPPSLMMNMLASDPIATSPDREPMLDQGEELHRIIIVTHDGRPPGDDWTAFFQRQDAALKATGPGVSLSSTTPISYSPPRPKTETE